MNQDLPDPSSASPAWKGHPPQMHGVSVYCDTALWVSESRVEQAVTDGNALWWHGFMVGAGLVLFVLVAMLLRDRRTAESAG